MKYSDLSTPLLMAVFQRSKEAMLQELKNIKNTVNQRTYEQDLTLAFWFAIHLEDLDLC